MFLSMHIDYGMSSFIAKNKLPTLKPNSYLHTQASEIRVTTEWSKQLHIFFAVYINLKMLVSWVMDSDCLQLFHSVFLRWRDTQTLFYDLKQCSTTNISSSIPHSYLCFTALLLQYVIA